MKARLLFVLCVALGYIAVFIAMDRLRAEPEKDETHYWPTSVLFAEEWIPSVELLRGYGELNTPLPFLLYGWLERACHGGIVAGRVLNSLLSLGIICVIALAGRAPPRVAIPAAVGLLLFPYYVGVSFHLYTDIVAAACVLGGIWLHQRKLPIPGAICFALAIASRQYMLAFPVAIALHELMLRSREPQRSHVAWAAPMLAAVTIVGWLVLFGGLAPTGELARQKISSGSLTQLYPGHALYFLTCVGLYFVPLEWALVRRCWNAKEVMQRRNLIIAGVLLAAFIAFPPLTNPETYGVPTMGYFDKAAHRVLGDADVLRMAVFYVFALAACVRFDRLTLPALLVCVNALLMMKAHIGWDKYILPLVVVLWFLVADRAPQARAS